MSPLQRYRQHRLAEPIDLGYGLGFRAMLFVVAPLLTLGSLYAALAYQGPGRAVGLFGMAFFGVAAALLYLAYRRADRGAAMRLGPDGIFMAHLGLTLPWARLGPAWVVETRQQHGTSRQAVVMLREPDDAVAAAGAFGRIIIGAASRAAGRARAAASWGGAALLDLAPPTAQDREAAEAILIARLERARDAAEAEGAVPIGAPLALHAGLTPEALAAILNAEFLRRDQIAPGPATGSAHEAAALRASPATADRSQV